jgi:hypothetical protein
VIHVHPAFTLPTSLATLITGNDHLTNLSPTL